MTAISLPTRPVVSPALWVVQFLAALGFGVIGFAASPAVTRIDPPSWWSGHTVNPVRLLVSGDNLTGVHIEVPDGFTITNLSRASSGRYILVDLRIPSDAKPGLVPFHFVDGEHETRSEFKLLAPLPSAGRFTGFSSEDVIYLLMPDRFANGDPYNDDPTVSRGLLDRDKPRHYHGGDFQGVINHLPYLRDLGVTALWLTPWYDNANQPNLLEKYTHDNQRSTNGVPSTDYHGYGAVDFYGVEERFGDMEKLRELVDAAHASGFKFIQDQVANHTGPYHPWVKNPPTPTWFNGTAENHLDNSWQTWTLAERDPPQDKLKSTLEGWFINILPDLNQNDPETATYLIQNSLWWIGMTGLDAVRQDTLPYVPRSYWSRWTTALKREYPQVTILGEMWDSKPELVAFFQGGRRQFDGVDSGIETLFDFPLHYAMRDVFAKGQSMTRLAQTLAADTNYVDARNLVTFLGLHDTPRFLSEPGASIEGLQLAFTYLLTTRGTPMIYYGDEIAMRGGGDPDNRRDFPGGWSQDKKNAFEQSGRSHVQERVHSHVKQLLALRRELAPLRHGELVQLESDDQTCAFARLAGDSGLIVVFNNSLQARTLTLTLPPALAEASQLFNRLGKNSPIPAKAGRIALTLAARSAAILAPEVSAVANDRGKPQARSSLR